MARIRAFTLLEVTIAMLITALAVGIMYSCYSMTQKLYASYADRQQRQHSIIDFSSVLNSDLFRCQSARATSGSEMELQESSGVLVTYSFLESCILRSVPQSRRDTFQLTASKVQFLFDNRPCENERIIDQVLLNAEVDSIAVSFSFSKMYSSEEIVKFKPNN